MSAQERSQQGFILLTVAMIGLLTTLLMGALVSHSVVTEARAVDQRLGEIRAHWVQMGHFRYAFSRIRQDYLCRDSDGVCNSNDSQQDSHMLEVLLTYLDEISAYRHVTFPDESANYWIDVGMTALVDPASTHGHSMHLIMRSSLPNTQSTLPVLQGLTQRAAPLEARFCVQLANWTDPCGPFGNNNFGGTLNGIYRIKRFSRM
jgi:hypothetical protein